MSWFFTDNARRLTDVVMVVRSLLRLKQNLERCFVRPACRQFPA